MSYINDFETELRKQLSKSPGEDAVVKWICAKVLESYKNGLATQSCEGLAPHQEV